MKQMSIGDKKTKRVFLNLIQQEAYTQCPQMLIDNDFGVSSKKYYELETVETADGYKETLVEKDYPITEEYVKSFESSSDYRNDISSAMSMPKKQGLGDITELQSLLERDFTAIQERMAQLKTLQAQQAQQAQSEINQVKKENSNE